MDEKYLANDKGLHTGQIVVMQNLLSVTKLEELICRLILKQA